MSSQRYRDYLIIRFNAEDIIFIFDSVAGEVGSSNKDLACATGCFSIPPNNCYVKLFSFLIKARNISSPRPGNPDRDRSGFLLI